MTRADGPERITREWRRRTSEAFSVRDYFRVENERGERCWVFRRGDDEHGRTGDLSWWMHGVFARNRPQGRDGLPENAVRR